MLPRDQKRLHKIREYCTDIQETMAQYGASFEVFQASRSYKYICSFCILQIGELVSGLSEEYRAATQSRVSWRQMKAMQNIVVHDYGSVDMEIVWEVMMTDIPNLIQFCDEQFADTK